MKQGKIFQPRNFAKLHFVGTVRPEPFPRSNSHFSTTIRAIVQVCTLNNFAFGLCQYRRGQLIQTFNNADDVAANIMLLLQFRADSD